MSTIFGWGNAQHGQLGIGDLDKDNVLTPKEIDSVQKLNTKQIICGERQSILLTEDGIIYSCGNNEYGQLGQTNINTQFEKIDSLSNMTVIKVCVGSNFCIALTTAGEVFSWGDNGKGQLGRGQVAEEDRGKAKLIKDLAMYNTVQIACGALHCLALTDDGKLFSWGANNYGQLGLGPIADFYDKPQEILCLKGIPIAKIVTGGYHSFVVSWSRAVFGWGKNSCGQLGVGDEKDRPHPAHCKSLRNQKVMYISCGEEHTAALTKDGGVFTFGSGRYGQLGHNSSQNEVLPRKVMELMGSTVSQIACGRCHTLAFVEGSRRLYSFGSGGCGQLGSGSTASRNSPCPVADPFFLGSNANDSQAMDHSGQQYCVKWITAGGDHCFMQVQDSTPDPPRGGSRVGQNRSQTGPSFDKLLLQMCCIE